MNIIVAGSRNFTDYNFLEGKLDKILSNLKEVRIISGGANGADKLGERYARSKGLNYIVVNADWTRYGKSAGMKRNESMAQMADGLIAFWDGKSHGTKHMIQTAKRHGLLIRIIRF